MDVDLTAEDKSASASYKVSKPGRKRKHLPVSDDPRCLHRNPLHVHSPHYLNQIRITPYILMQLK